MHTRVLIYAHLLKFIKKIYFHLLLNVLCGKSEVIRSRPGKY